MNSISLFELINNISAKHKDKTAFWIRRRVKKQKILYADIPSYINKIVTFFKKQGIKEKEKILVWGLNCPEYTILMIATFCTNRILVPVDFRNEEPFITEIIRQTKPRAAFVSKYINQKFVNKLIKKVFVLEDLFSLIENHKNDLEIVQKSFMNPNNIVEIVYTSGTTGTPKGVVLTQKNILTNVFAFAESVPKLKFYKTISILPLSHIYEQIAGLWGILPLGCDIMYLTRNTSFQILKATKEQNPTHLLFIPQMFEIFLENIRVNANQRGKLKKFEIALKLAKYIHISFRKILFYEVHKLFGNNFQFFGSGGAPLNIKTAQIWQDLGFEILEGYGATETTAVATLNKRGESKLGSVGKPINNTKIVINQNGEIIIEGEAVASGYFKNKAKTDLVFKKNYYKTGDVGYFDNDGYLYVRGRDSNKIVLGSGEKIYAEDLEKSIKSHREIKDCCVIEANTSHGLTPFAYVILERKNDLSKLESIFMKINSNLESKQQITHFKVWPNIDFPRTNTYKIDRPKVVETLKNNNFDIQTGIKQPNHIVDVYDILTNISGIPHTKIRESDNLSRNIKLDSLGRLELISQIEEFLGIEVDEKKINQNTTVSSLVQLIKESKSSSSLELTTWQFSQIGLLINQIIRNCLVFPLHAFFVKLDIVGIKNLMQIQGGFMIIANHPGPLDVVVLYRILKEVGRYRIATLGHSKFWLNPLKYGYFNKLIELSGGGIPLFENGKELLWSLQTISNLMDENYVSIVLPQGMIQTKKIKTGFQHGIAYMAKEFEKPIVPIMILDYEKIWRGLGRDGSKLSDFLPKRVGVAKVMVGNPMNYSEFQNMSLDETLKYIENKFKTLTEILNTDNDR